MKAIGRVRALLFVVTALVAMVAVPALASAATIELKCNFDTTNDDNVSAPYVGNGTLSYQNSVRLPSGLYSLKTLRDTYGATFTATLTSDAIGGTQTWSLADLVSPIDVVNVYIIGESFVFTSPEASSGTQYGGSADYLNTAGYIFTQEPLYDDCTSKFRGTSITYPLYQVRASSAITSLLFGNYGGSVGAVLADANLDAGLDMTPSTPTPTPATSVPASSPWSVVALVVVGLALPLALRRRGAAR